MVFGVFFITIVSVGTLSQAALKRIQFRNALQNTAWSLSALDSSANCTTHAQNKLTTELAKFGMTLQSSSLIENASVQTSNRRIKLTATTDPILSFAGGLTGDLTLMLEDGTACTGLPTS
jgi:hypothetical protein